MNIDRRQFSSRFALLISAFAFRPIAALGKTAASATAPGIGNFEYIYSNTRLRKEFFNFFVNVFHLYPEHEFDRAIHEILQHHKTDKAIYRELQQRLNDIKPLLSEFRYALPALAKQKAVMTVQTLQLLGDRRTVDGYMEIGSTGRYLDDLEDALDVGGSIFMLHTQRPTYSPADVVDRGQITKIGTFVDMKSYSTDFTNVVPAKSLDLVTVFIGFHHCPIPKRKDFIGAVSQTLKHGGTLILRDHDVRDEDSARIAALAHDTFNAGTGESWQTNEYELRSFYSLPYIIDFLRKFGLRHTGRVLFQDGDPTRNGLMAFTRI